MNTMKAMIIAGILALAACGTTEPGKEPAAVVADSATTKPIAKVDGPQVIHLKEGGRLEGNMSNGQRTGTWTSYHPNGKVWSRSTYVGGLEEGPTEVFQDNGLPFYTGAYHKGKPTGEWVFFDNLGKETKRVMHDSTGAVLN